MEYGVAYLDKDGKGFSRTEPWVMDSTEDRCVKDSTDLLSDGYPRAIPFKYDAEKIESISWKYVMKHVVSK